MAPKTITIGGVELARRGATRLGTLRGAARLRDEFGFDLFGELTEAGLMGLLEKPGGPRALLAALYKGPVEQIDEDDLEVADLTGAVKDFFAASAAASTGPAGGSPTAAMAETAPSAQAASVTS